MSAIFFIAFLVLGLVQAYAGFLGLEYQFGIWAGYLGLIAMFVFRFSLPITVGTFICAWQVWQWHWALALLFTAPGLVLAVPALISSFVGAISGSLRKA